MTEKKCHVSGASSFTANLEADVLVLLLTCDNMTCTWFFLRNGREGTTLTHMFKYYIQLHGGCLTK